MGGQRRDEFQLYEQQVPGFVEHELDRLYGARYASMPHLMRKGGLAGASTFVIRECGAIVALLVFVRRQGVVTVLNEGMTIDAGHIACFAACVFRRDRAAQVIRFEAVEARLPQPGLLRQCLPCAIDSEMALPPTSEAWLATLNGKFRNKLKRYITALEQAEPSFEFAVHERAGVEPEHVRAIIELNRRRMDIKHKVSTIDGVEAQHIVDYVRERGFVGVARIGGRVCAGVILYRLGKNFSLRILAHEPAYHHLNLGSACFYLTLKHAMDAGGGGRFFFGWGEEPFKSRFGARPRQLNRILIYRSALAAARHGALGLRALRDAALLRTRAFVRHVRRRFETDVLGQPAKM